MFDQHREGDIPWVCPGRCEGWQQSQLLWDNTPPEVRHAKDVHADASDFLEWLNRPAGHDSSG